MNLIQQYKLNNKGNTLKERKMINPSTFSNKKQSVTNKGGTQQYNATKANSKKSWNSYASLDRHTGVNSFESFDIPVNSVLLKVGRFSGGCNDKAPSSESQRDFKQQLKFLRRQENLLIIHYNFIVNKVELGNSINGAHCTITTMFQVIQNHRNSSLCVVPLILLLILDYQEIVNKYDYSILSAFYVSAASVFLSLANDIHRKFNILI
ncbi:MAG: hypothetical protein EXX96DRAFT_610392 [Benjaminiella poitrasii]|nr:MAG: hypothetical protein EXX96DRAFT_610392 [Benjaminiella poitrasii]